MIELFENNIETADRQSSKGNQLKWKKDDKWYKADYTGYEGLSEYVVSHLLGFSNLSTKEYINYDGEEIIYEYSKYNGCVSEDFLDEGWQLITLERLFYNTYNESLTKSLYKIADTEKRLKFLVEQIERITGLEAFGEYISKLVTMDAMFLNEDRHLHNIAVLTNLKGEFEYCPIFDNGAALMSDTTMDYPLNVEIERLVGKVKSKTFCDSFDEQLDVAERLYGQHIKFNFSKKNVENLLKEEKYYDKDIKDRVKEIIYLQMRKYQYLF